MSEKSHSVAQIDGTCFNASTCLQRIKALTRTYAQNPTPENAVALNDEVGMLEKCVTVIRGQLVNVVTEHEQKG